VGFGKKLWKGFDRHTQGEEGEFALWLSVRYKVLQEWLFKRGTNEEFVLSKEGKRNIQTFELLRS